MAPLLAPLLRKLAPFRRTLSDAAFENMSQLNAMKGFMTYKEGLALVGTALTVGVGTLTCTSWGTSGQLAGMNSQLAGLEKGMDGQLEGVKGRLDGLTSRIDDMKAELSEVKAEVKAGLSEVKAGQAQLLADLSAVKAAVLSRG